MTSLIFTGEAWKRTQNEMEANGLPLGRNFLFYAAHNLLWRSRLRVLGFPNYVFCGCYNDGSQISNSAHASTTLDDHKYCHCIVSRYAGTA
jgi:hypothetical protein